MSDEKDKKIEQLEKEVKLEKKKGNNKAFGVALMITGIVTYSANMASPNTQFLTYFGYFLLFCGAYFISKD